MGSKIYDNLIYSMNPAVQKDAFSAQVQSDVEGTYGKVKSAIGTIVNVGKDTYDVISKTIEAAKSSEGTNISLKDFNIVPTSVENVFGEKYAEALCPAEQVDKESEMNAVVQEIGQKIIAQSDRKDLDFSITVKKDHSDINAYVIPGGKIVVTSGLLNKLYENSESVEEFKNKVSSTLGYLVARSSLSQQVKQVQTSGLIEMISKVIKFVFGLFFPVNQDSTVKAKVKMTPEAKKQQAIGKIVDLSVDLGEKILIDHQKKSAEKEARELALKYTQDAGFKVEQEDLDDTLEIVFEEDESEAADEQIQENLVKIFPQVTKLFA